MRTYQEILDNINAQVALEPALSVYDNASQTSRFGLIKRCIALAQYIQEGVIWNIFDKIYAIVNARYFGTPEWYVSTAKAFMYGATLTVEGNKVVQQGGYEIIARAACVAPGRTVTIKVCTDVGGVLTALPSPEMTAFQSYMEKVKPAGIKLQYTSLNADRLRVAADVYYDGQLDLSTFQTAVVAALEAYMAALPFNGDVYVSKVMDAIQSVSGVKDVGGLVVSLRQGATLTVIPRVAGTLSGYLVQEDSTSYTFLDTLNFIAQ